MNVIGHQAVCYYLQPMLVCILVQEFKIPLPVGTVKEDILSPIATLSNVMRNTSKNRSRYPRHSPIVARISAIVN